MGTRAALAHDEINLIAVALVPSIRTVGTLAPRNRPGMRGSPGRARCAKCFVDKGLPHHPPIVVVELSNERPAREQRQIPGLAAGDV